jgi:hypothetical protein
MNTGKFHRISGQTRSIFNKNGASGLEKSNHIKSGAGIGPSSTMHNFIFHNGYPENPQIFANFVKNGIKDTYLQRKNLQLYG